MLNNCDHDIRIFKNLIDFLKVGGHVIFATKLDLHNKDIYAPLIKQLEKEGMWQFTSEHMFYRYDKLCDNKGKFSRKFVKILTYQKIDRYKFIQEEERAKA
jgi:hypothetical protein